MYNEPCMKLVTLSVPKMRDKPAATKNSNMPLIKPPVVCVMMQDVLVTQENSASKSKIYPLDNYEQNVELGLTLESETFVEQVDQT